ncbi:MAG TPA: endonuclease NucS [Nakamurella multipartita]|nr:endonuclease NucS [Nakamurella multipartita]
MRLVVARCSVDYVGRLTAHLDPAVRLLMVKADGSVLVHADGGSYKPLNWMSPPCRLVESDERWTVENKAGERLVITLDEVLHDSTHDLGADPGLVKDGVEAHLQALLAEHVGTLGDGWTLVRREFPTPIGPVDLMCRDGGPEIVLDAPGDGPGELRADGAVVVAPAPVRSGYVAVEVKRRATIDAVEQLTRYLDYLNRDPLLAPVSGVLAAQSIAPQARTLAQTRGIRCVVLDYESLRGIEVDGTLF